VAVVLGRGVRIADLRSTPATPLTPAAALAASPAPASVRARRRAVPLPTIGVALAAAAVGLETTGLVVRLDDGIGREASLLSMDAPFSLPRMFVALTFAAGAVLAVAGAGGIPGRRTWWLGVGLVGAGIAGIKAGSTVHAQALAALSRVVGSTVATVLSVLLAAAVIGVMAMASRTERRDRRRILGVLALYATAAVGLSAVSSAVAEALGAGSSWAAGATYLEESGEALAGVAFLFAVALGVAPRLVLPARWALRREADAYTLDVRDGVPVQAERRGTPAR